MYCIAPIGGCEGGYRCDQSAVSNSQWCPKHLRKFGGLASKYHELESKLILDPIKYTDTKEYLNWSNETIKTEFCLLWRIYSLRLKVWRQGFAKEIRDSGHKKRLTIINNCLSILNNIMKTDEVDCEEDEIDEQDDRLVVGDVLAIKTTNQMRNKKIKEQEFIGIWTSDDVMIYCRRAITNYLLACLRKYFQRWPDGDLMLEHSIAIACSASCKCKCVKYKEGVHYLCGYKYTYDNFLYKGSYSILPILAVIQFYNINLSKIINLVEAPKWLIKRFDFLQGAKNHIVMTYFHMKIKRRDNKTVLEVIKDDPKYGTRYYNRLIDRFKPLLNGTVKLPIINIPTVIKAIKSGSRIEYTIRNKTHKLFVDSVCTFEQDAKDISCNCDLLGFTFINTRILLEEIGHLLVDGTDLPCTIQSNCEKLTVNRNLHLTFLNYTPEQVAIMENNYIQAYK